MALRVAQKLTSRNNRPLAPRGPLAPCKEDRVSTEDNTLPMWLEELRSRTAISLVAPLRWTEEESKERLSTRKEEEMHKDKSCSIIWVQRASFSLIWMLEASQRCTKGTRPRLWTMEINLLLIVFSGAVSWVMNKCRKWLCSQKVVTVQITCARAQRQEPWGAWPIQVSKITH